MRRLERFTAKTSIRLASLAFVVHSMYTAQSNYMWQHFLTLTYETYVWACEESRKTHGIDCNMKRIPYDVEHTMRSLLMPHWPHEESRKVHGIYWNVNYTSWVVQCIYEYLPPFWAYQESRKKPGMDCDVNGILWVCSVHNWIQSKSSFTRPSLTSTLNIWSPEGSME